MEADNSSNFKEIDVKELFYDKNPKLARWIPGFIYRYLRKVKLSAMVLWNISLPSYMNLSISTGIFLIPVSR